ncbi:hypothetical protein [Chishuiella sp.]|uniref:hypothetical protein n=1 Tax=Chishuiella sp. TaxID=1969467 RepID=UPI0028AFF63E|nr:hypothetical protein [Chishuiella sp.]
MSHYRYKVRHGENMTTVAEAYRIDREELRLFHNKHCDLGDDCLKIFESITPYICIPWEVRKRYSATTIRTFELVAPPKIEKINYGIIYRNNTKDKQLHYTLSLEKSVQNIVQITKDKLYLNNHNVDSVIEQLFEKIGNILYPLQLEVTQKQEINRIYNDSELKERWKTLLPWLKLRYNSEIYDQIETKTTLFFKNPNDYISQIFNDIFYAFYFMPIYRKYKDGIFNTTSSILLSSINQKINFNLNFKLHKHYTKSGKILLEVNGEEIHSILNDKKCKLDFSYKLHKETHKIFSVLGKITCYDDNLEEQELTFEIYELN